MNNQVLGLEKCLVEPKKAVQLNCVKQVSDLDSELETLSAQLFNGDCLDLMSNFPDNSVDMIFCDLPYGTTACKWDSIIPFEELWKQYKRIIKEGRCVALFGSEPFSSRLRLSNLEWYKYDWIWKKSRKSGYVHSKGMPLREHEFITIFSNGGIRRNSRNPMVYTPQGVVPFSTTRKNYVKTTRAYQGGMEIGTEWEQEGVFYPTSILSFKNVRPKEQIHPTQKPVDLLEYLIKTYTTENETVLDNCMGVGSTGIACFNTSRNFIGIEIERNFYEFACNRIEKWFTNTEQIKK